jgi:transposase
VTKKNNNKKTRARYTEQFKAEVLRAVETRGNRTIAEVAEAHGVPEHRIHEWKRVAKQNGNTANDRGETMEQEVRRLRRELAEVKKDRDVLLKSVAVFVKERK